MEVFADPPFAPRPNTATAMTQIVLRLTDGTTPIRGMVVPGKGQWFSVYDFMWNTGSFSSKNAVTTIFSRMISDKSEHKEEVTSMCCYLKFPGPGQRETPCMSVMGLQRLLCLLGGKIGQQYRELATTTLTRVAAGDTSLIEEIGENAVSNTPVQQLAREALATTAAVENGNEDVVMRDYFDERMQEFAPLVPVVKKLTDTLATLQAKCDHETRLRHQSDGRYGSEIREANKFVQQKAEHWRKQAENAEERCVSTQRNVQQMQDLFMKAQDRIDERDKMLIECHRMLTHHFKTTNAV